MSEINASVLNLFKQAPWTAQSYMIEAIEAIDKAFDEKGYAKKHPELVGSFIKTAAMDFNTGVTNKVNEKCMAEITHALHKLGTNNAATDMGALEFIGDAIIKSAEAVADAISELEKYGGR